MPYKVIVPKGSAPPLAPYSPGTKAGNVGSLYGVQDGQLPNRDT
jgi:hypothetical protein